MKNKQQKINKIFETIAKNYDRMNSVISLGTHKYFKRKAVNRLNLKSTDLVLDLATGTGDIAKCINRLSSAKIIMADLNPEMLRIAHQRLPKSVPVNCDAASLPFQENSFDKVIIGFGIRNFTRRSKAFQEIYRVMKPDATLVILEFAQPPVKLIRFLRNIYFLHIIPGLSQLLIAKKQEYRYLADSVINFPDQAEIITSLQKQSFKNCTYRNYLLGGLAIYCCGK